MTDTWVTEKHFWQTFYNAAIQENGRIERHIKIEIAHAAIQQRVKELSNESNDDRHVVEELQEIGHALDILQALLGFSSSSEVRTENMQAARWN